jgi:hypothetical protein
MLNSAKRHSRPATRAQAAAQQRDSTAAAALPSACAAALAALPCPRLLLTALACASIVLLIRLALLSVRCPHPFPVHTLARGTPFSLMRTLPPSPSSTHLHTARCQQRPLPPSAALGPF